MKIGLVLIATGKYDVFLQPLIDSVDKFFFRGDEITIYLFTDKTPKLIHSDRIHTTIIATEHKPFPYPTLYRYKYISSIAENIYTDYLFYCDVDMRFVDLVGREILGDIVCVQHPGFYKGGWGSDGCDERSLAYLPKELCFDYVCGGFNGGRRKPFLEMCSILNDRISKDEKNGVMAIYHDETHFNWYIKKMAKNIHKLNPSYCYPELWKIPFIKRILALEKNHKEIRGL